MKRNYLKIALLSATMTFIASSCGSKPQDNSTQVEEPATIDPADQPAEEIDEPFSTKKVSIERKYKKITCKIVVDFPTTGNEELKGNAKGFINNSLGGSYKGDLNNPEAMLEYYALNTLDFLKEGYEDMNEAELFSECIITVSNESGNSITYTHHHYDFAGGAHPNTTFNTAVFRKSDGKCFTWDMVDTNNNEFDQIFKTGLKAYFGNADMSDDELQENLLVDGTENIPLPSTPPYFANGKMEIFYNRYEIACYAAGNPAVEIPIATAKKFLNNEGLTFLN